MEFYEVVKKRRTTREWQNKDVPLDVIKRIIDAGLAAPSNNHLREWEFVVLHDPEEKDNALGLVKAWTAEHGLSDPDRLFPVGTIQQRMYKYAMPRQYSMLRSAPYVIIPLFKANRLNCEYVNQLNAFASIWCVVENIFLAATAEGLGYSMRIPVGTEGESVCKALGVPGDYMMPCYIGIGYPAEGAPSIEQHAYTADQKIHVTPPPSWHRGQPNSCMGWVC